MRITRYTCSAIAAMTLALMGSIDSRAQDFASTPDYLTNILLTDSLGMGLSQEAKMIIGRPFSYETSVTTAEQQQLMAFLNAPRVLDALDFTTLQIKAPEMKSYDGKHKRWTEAVIAGLNRRAEESRFGQLSSKWSHALLTRERAMLSRPHLIQLSINDLPEAIKPEEIQSKGYQGQLAYTEEPKIKVEDNNIVAGEVARKYWWHNLEGSVQFAQNQISQNWHKGGYSNLNLNTRLYYKATYVRERVKWINEVEYRLGLFTNQQGEEEKRQLKIGEDLFRAYTNLGVKAFDHWYYTISAQLRSQAFTNHKNEGVAITQPFAPISIDGGIGMKYELDFKKFRGNPFARFRFSANLSPVGMDFTYTYTDDIDKGRIGLEEGERNRFRFGSSLRLDLNWDFSSAINWTSRLFYNTSYKHTEVEFDNSVNYSFNQFFSLRFTLNTRFDDSVILPEDKPMNFKSLLQYNQLLSIGFAYKI